MEALNAQTDQKPPFAFSMAQELTSSIWAPSLPSSSPLRTALQAALQGTQTQSDNVGHVLLDSLLPPLSLSYLRCMHHCRL